MRVPMSLVLGLVVLIFGSFISQSYAEVGELGEHEFPNPSVGEEEIREIKRQIRTIETTAELSNGEEQTTASRDDRDIPQVSADGLHKKRHVSFSISGSTDKSGGSATVPETRCLALSNPDASTCDYGKSSFTSKITGCFTKIVNELKMLIEYTKLSFSNLKSEMSLGPQKDELLNEKASAANRSLIITGNEFQSFVDHLPRLIQVVVNEPEQLQSVGDAISYSVPTNKISCCISNLHNHVLELLGIIKDWLCTNEKAKKKILVMENEMALLRASKFDNLYACPPSSSQTVFPTVSTREGLATWDEQSSVKSDFIAEKFKTLHLLCDLIRQVPILLMKIMAILKTSLFTIHENGGLCSKLRNHPLFSLPVYGSLLPDRDDTTVYIDPLVTASEEYGRRPSTVNFAPPFRPPPSVNNGFLSKPIIPPQTGIITSSGQTPSRRQWQLNYPNSHNSGFPQPPVMQTGPGTTGCASCRPMIPWLCTSPGSCKFENEHQALSAKKEDIAGPVPTLFNSRYELMQPDNIIEEPLSQVLLPSDPTIQYGRPWFHQDTAHNVSPPSLGSPDSSCKLLNAAAAKFNKVAQCKSWIPAMMGKSASLTSSLGDLASLAIPSGKISVSMGTPSGSSAPSPRGSPDYNYELNSAPDRAQPRSWIMNPYFQPVIAPRLSAVSMTPYEGGQAHKKHGLLNKFKNGCCLCKKKSRSSSPRILYAPTLLPRPINQRSYRENVPFYDYYSRERRNTPSYFISSADSPSARTASNPTNIASCSSSSLLKPSNILASIFFGSAINSNTETDASQNNERPATLYFSEPSSSSTQGNTSSSGGQSSSSVPYGSGGLMIPVTDSFNAQVNGGGAPAANSPAFQGFSNPLRPPTDDFNGPANGADASLPAPSASEASSDPSDELDIDEEYDEHE